MVAIPPPVLLYGGPVIVTMNGEGNAATYMTPMRTIYRCNYTFKGEFGPARESKAFQTEQEAREYAESLEARGYIAVVWRERQVKTGGRWETDLDE